MVFADPKERVKEKAIAEDQDAMRIWMQQGLRWNEDQDATRIKI